MKQAHRILIAIAALYIAGYAFHAWYLRKTVYGDGSYYYAWLTGSASKFSVGPAIAWAPVYIATRSEFAVGAVSVLAAIFGLTLLYTMLAQSFSPAVSIASVAAVALASNLLFYGSLDAVNSHALSFFAVTVFLAMLRCRRWFAVGATLGVVALMRAQDLAFGILIIPLLTKKTVLPVAAGFLLAFAPQLAAWQLVSGKFWVSPYLVREGFILTRPHILDVLFGRGNGLFLWTPAAMLGAAGLITFKRYAYLIVFLAELFIVATWSTWWQGASYSGRMFVSSLPLLAYGIAHVFSWLETRRFGLLHFFLIIVAPLSLVNAVSILYFLLTQ